MSSIVLMSDQRVVAIPLQECGRGLRPRPARGPHPDAARTVAAAHRRASAVRRGPPALQRRYFEEYSDELARAHPDWQAAQLREAASRFVPSPEIALHSAGAAVDPALIDHQGRELDMGTRVNASPEESMGACCTGAPASATKPARTGRL